MLLMFIFVKQEQRLEGMLSFIRGEITIEKHESIRNVIYFEVNFIVTVNKIPWLQFVNYLGWLNSCGEARVSSRNTQPGSFQKKVSMFLLYEYKQSLGFFFFLFPDPFWDGIILHSIKCIPFLRLFLNHLSSHHFYFVGSVKCVYNCINSNWTQIL